MDTPPVERRRSAQRAEMSRDTNALAFDITRVTSAGTRTMPIVWKPLFLMKLEDSARMTAFCVGGSRCLRQHHLATLLERVVKEDDSRENAPKINSISASIMSSISGFVWKLARLNCDDKWS